MVPELVPLELVKEVEQEMEICEEASPQDTSLPYLCITTTAAIAFYYFKIGQVSQFSNLLLLIS